MSKKMEQIRELWGLRPLRRKPRGLVGDSDEFKPYEKAYINFLHLIPIFGGCV
jgi:hypothetical protein